MISKDFLYQAVHDWLVSNACLLMPLQKITHSHEDCRKWVFRYYRSLYIWQKVQFTSISRLVTRHHSASSWILMFAFPLVIIPEARDKWSIYIWNREIPYLFLLGSSYQEHLTQEHTPNLWNDVFIMFISLNLGISSKNFRYLKLAIFQ